MYVDWSRQHQPLKEVLTFVTIGEVRAQSFKWMMQYHYERPHEALQVLSPHKIEMWKILAQAKGAEGLDNSYRSDNNSTNNAKYFCTIVSTVQLFKLWRNIDKTNY